MPEAQSLMNSILICALYVVELYSTWDDRHGWYAVEATAIVHFKLGCQPVLSTMRPIPIKH